MHGDVVVGELGDWFAVGPTEHEAVADGVDVRGDLERCTPHERRDQVEGGGGRIAGLAVDVQLGAHERDVGAAGQLDRPAVVVAVTQARTGACQAVVGAVVVDRVLVLGAGGLGRHVDAEVARGRDVEVGVGDELELALLR